MEMRHEGFSGFNPKAAHQVRLINVTTIAGTIATTLFVTAELFSVVAASVWAVTGYFHLSLLPTVALATLVGVPAMWIAAVVARLAFDAETDPDNN